MSAVEPDPADSPSARCTCTASATGGMSEFRTRELLLLIIFTAGPRPSQSDTYAVGRQGEVT